MLCFWIHQMSQSVSPKKCLKKRRRMCFEEDSSVQLLGLPICYSPEAHSSYSYSTIRGRGRGTQLILNPRQNKLHHYMLCLVPTYPLHCNVSAVHFAQCRLVAHTEFLASCHQLRPLACRAPSPLHPYQSPCILSKTHLLAGKLILCIPNTLHMEGA